ncbi:hypothetical protein PRNP1_001372 [Phytophthora ramorum]
MLGLHQYREKVEKPAARADISSRMLVLVERGGSRQDQEPLVRPWRRVIFEEVQDLVLSGNGARDSFIHLIVCG